MDLQYFVELFCGGLTRGSIYALIALGYTMVYGIIELINFAHGEIYMSARSPRSSWRVRSASWDSRRRASSSSPP